MRIALFCIMAERTKHIHALPVLISLLSGTTQDVSKRDVGETTCRRNNQSPFRSMLLISFCGN